jgi:hypothetical protein
MGLLGRGLRGSSVRRGWMQGCGGLELAAWGNCRSLRDDRPKGREPMRGSFPLQGQDDGENLQGQGQGQGQKQKQIPTG